MINEIWRTQRNFLENYPGHNGAAVVIVHSSASSPTVIESGFRGVLPLGFDDDLPSVGSKTMFSNDHAERFMSFVMELHKAPGPVKLIIQGETTTLRRASALALFAHAYCGGCYLDLDRSHNCCRSVLAVLHECFPDVTVKIPNEKNV